MFYPITPCPKPRMTQRDKWKKRPAVMRYRAFKDKCRAHGVKLPQPCEVIFSIPMPKSWSETKRSKMVGKPHQAKPDLDNLIKGLWDATVRNDERLWSVHAEKRWGAGGGIFVRALEREREAA